MVPETVQRKVSRVRVGGKGMSWAARYELSKARQEHLPVSNAMELKYYTKMREHWEKAREVAANGNDDMWIARYYSKKLQHVSFALS